MRELLAHLARGLRAGRPVDDQGGPGASEPRVALPEPQGRVAGPRPSPGVVVVRAEAAPVVERGQVVLDRLGDARGEAVLVHAALDPTLGARPVVREEEDERVVELPHLVEERDEPPDLGVGMAEEAGEHLLHPGVHAPLVGREGGPVGYPRWSRRERGALGDHAAVELAGEDALPPRLPASVVAAAVGLDPLGGHVVGGVHRPKGQVEKEGLVRCGVVLVEHTRDGPVDEILAQVVAVLRRPGRVDVVVVGHEVRSPLVGVALQEAVVALEAEPERPVVEGSRRRAVVAGDEMPLPDGQGPVARVAQDAGQRGGGLGDAGRIAGIGHRDVGEETHADRMMVAPREEARPGRRAQRRDVEAVVAEPTCGEPVHVRSGDVGAEAAELGEPGVVEDDGHHVGRAGCGARFRRHHGRRVRRPQPEPWCLSHCDALLRRPPRRADRRRLRRRERRCPIRRPVHYGGFESRRLPCC